MDPPCLSVTDFPLNLNLTVTVVQGNITGVPRVRQFGRSSTAFYSGEPTPPASPGPHDARPAVRLLQQGARRPPPSALGPGSVRRLLLRRLRGRGAAHGGRGPPAAARRRGGRGRLGRQGLHGAGARAARAGPAPGHLAAPRGGGRGHRRLPGRGAGGRAAAGGALGAPAHRRGLRGPLRGLDDGRRGPQHGRLRPQPLLLHLLRGAAAPRAGGRGAPRGSHARRDRTQRGRHGGDGAHELPAGRRGPAGAGRGPGLPGRGGRPAALPPAAAGVAEGGRAVRALPPPRLLLRGVRVRARGLPRPRARPAQDAGGGAAVGGAGPGALGRAPGAGPGRAAPAARRLLPLRGAGQPRALPGLRAPGRPEPRPAPPGHRQGPPGAGRGGAAAGAAAVPTADFPVGPRLLETPVPCQDPAPWGRGAACKCHGMNPSYLSPAFVCSWERDGTCYLRSCRHWGSGLLDVGAGDSWVSERGALNDLPFLSEWELGGCLPVLLWDLGVLRWP